MENAIRSSASDNTFKTLKSGEYQTKYNDTVTYRVYKRKSMGEDEIHIYHLIGNKFIAYWAIAPL